MPMSSKTQTMATKAVFTGGAMQAADLQCSDWLQRPADNALSCPWVVRQAELPLGRAAGLWGPLRVPTWPVSLKDSPGHA